jgi:feruloyl esterase
MAPGMDHCGGGDGPSEFGQYDAGGGDPEKSLGAALQRWDEQGIAPEHIIAAKLKDDDDPNSQILRTRPLCSFPAVARYIGKGSTDRAESFVCKLPAEE